MEALMLKPAIAELFLASAATCLVLVAAFVTHQEKAARLMRKLSIATLMLTGVLVYAYGGAAALAFDGFFITSSFTVYMKLLVLIGAVAVLLVSKNHLSHHIKKPEFNLLLLFSVLGMMVMISSNNLMVLYMGIELQSLPLYVVAAMNRDSLKSSEAGLKYFLLGALSSGMLLYGLSLIYGFTGSIDYNAIALALADNASTGVVIGIVVMIAGIAFKISAAPFHMWTPDVYEGSPTTVTAFFAIVPKVAAMALFLRVAYGMLAPVPEVWQQVIIALALLSMLVGALGAIMQTELKRLLAYSSIAHVGYALVGFSSAVSSGLSAVMLYMTIYVISAIGVFTIILDLTRDGIPAHKIADLKGFSKSHPFQAGAMLVFMFSMAGIPPLGGFFGKWFAFLAAIEAGLIVLVIVGVLASVVGAFYYLRIVKMMFIDDIETPLDKNQEGINGLVAGVAAVAMLIFALLLDPVREIINACIQNLIVIG